METYISAPIDGVIYILEVARQGSKKLSCSSMPADRPEPDWPIDIRKVPLRVRRAAREQLGVVA